MNTASLSTGEVERIDAYWRAANYLSVGQIYLLDNPLLREPLAPEHVKPRLLEQLEDLADLAPLHEPKSLAGIEAVGAVLADVPAVACFDTAFHSGLPPAACTYALPVEWRTRWEVRRYGFHGLSHSYASRRAAELVRRPLGDLRVVVCHLGAGASLRSPRSLTASPSPAPPEV